MHMTSKGRYAVAAMVDVACHEDTGPVPLHDLSVRQNVSISYLEPMFSSLRKNGLVQSTRGPGGGYSLAKASELITVAEIVKSFDEEVFSFRESERFNMSIDSLTEQMWAQLNVKAMEYLESISLASLIAEGANVTNSIKPRVTMAHGIQDRPVRLNTVARVPNSVFALGQLVLN